MFARWFTLLLALEGVLCLTTAPETTASATEEDVILDAELLNAKIIGTKTYIDEDRSIFIYKGLRYSTGQPERFQIAELAEPYSGGNISAKVSGSPCPQKNTILPNAIEGTGDEDCLFLNVYTPVETPDGDKLPVMVYFHGGDFIRGDSSLYQPTALLKEDVLLVVPHFRLGALSFFTTGDSLASGNMGLHDQKLALEWVASYISDFGGDPTKVTIFGQDSGAISVTYHVLSENSNDFSNAIVQSGTALDFNGYDSNPRWTSLLLALTVPGCQERLPIDSPDDIVSLNDESIQQALIAAYTCLVKFSDYRDIAVAYDILMMQYLENYDPRLPYPYAAPSIESPATQNPIVAKSPFEAIQDTTSDRVPLMIGTVGQEGSIPFGEMYAKYLGPTGKSDDSNYVQMEMVPEVLQFYGIDDPTTAIAETFKMQFLSYVEQPVYREYCEGMIDMIGSLSIKYPTLDLADALSLWETENPVYVYSLDYAGSSSLFQFYFRGEDDHPPCDQGVSHSDDLIYLFDLPNLGTDADKRITDQMVKLWTTFATNGNPTPTADINDLDDLGIPQWPKFEALSPVYMAINEEITINNDYRNTLTITAKEYAGETSTMDPGETANTDDPASTASPDPSSNTDPNPSSTDGTASTDRTAPTGNPTTSEKPVNPSSEKPDFGQLYQDYQELQDQRDAYLITMIIFIILFVVAAAAAAFFFMRSRR